MRACTSRSLDRFCASILSWLPDRLKPTGLGLSPAQALRNIREFRTRTHLLPESRNVDAELKRLVDEHAVQEL